MRVRTCTVLFLALLFAWPVAAQETRGSIEGVIKDSSGAVLPGATVEAKSASGGSLTSVTDSNGVYRFPVLDPGRYEVTVTLSGFTQTKSAPVSVLVGQVLKVDLAMAVASVSETVSVLAESPTIDVRQATAATNIRAEEIDRIPKGRDFQSLVTLAAGANMESRSGGISIDGASAAENKWYLDGIDTTNLRTGVSATPFLTDFISEVQVKSSGYAAEFGGATGGVVSVISKSGSNQFRGEGGFYVNNDALNGSLAMNNTGGTAGGTTYDRRQLRLLLTGENLAETVTYPKDDYSRWDPHFQVGGPVLTDKMWFWAGYTPTMEDTNRTVTFRSNQQTGTYESKETTQNLVGNLTWQMSQPARLRVSGQYRPYDRDGLLPNPNGTNNPATVFAITSKQPNNTATGSFDYVGSNRVFFNTKVNYLEYDRHDNGIPNEIRYIFTAGSNNIYETRPNLVQSAGYTNILTNQLISKDKYSRIGWSADSTFFVNAGGQHTFKGGVQFERIENDVANVEQQPNVSFGWNTSHTNLDGTVNRGQYGYYSWRVFGTLGKVNVNNLGLFFQDAWTVNNRLTINAGVRTEREDIPSYRPNLNGIKFSFGDKLAPRVGVAYDLKGDGKWKAFGSWGVFYDTMKLELPRGSFGGDVWIEHYYNLDTLDWNTVGVNGVFPGKFLEDVDFRIPSNDPACPECGAIDPNLKPFRQQELVGGIEHELTARMAVSARYVHKQVDRAIEDVGVIVPGLGGVFYIANPGEGVATTIEAATCPTCPGLPKIQRDYDAVELKFTRRFANNWSGGISYTLSRLYGNYPGLASSDEIARVAPNVTRLFDGLVMAFRPGGEPVYGRLNTDRPNQFKLNGVYVLKSQTTLAAVFRAASGIPITRQVNMISSLPVFYNGRLSDGRTQWLTLTDLSVQQDIPMPGSRLKGQLSLNVLNLFDQNGVTDVFRVQTRENLPVPLETFFAGFDVQQRIASTAGIRIDPRFLQNSAWQPAREIRFGVKLIF
jgi:Carboxypeptidase regulatory-like domain/TonB dependent receptor-like, beta-barrel/TonB-dependent Receptor Plug Domain